MVEKNFDESKEVSKICTELTYGTWRKQSGWSPLTVESEEGCYFRDSNGKSYLDFSSQLMCSNLGHRNQRIIKAINDQLEKFEYVQPGYATEIRAEVALLLKRILPSSLTKYFFGASGTEANEAAIKTVRMFFQKERKTKIISNYNSYHGSTSGSITLTGDFRRTPVDTYYSIPGVVHSIPPYCYRCPLKLKLPDCDFACADYNQYLIKNEGNIGGMIVEPVTGTNGVIIPPDGYLQRIRQITRENDVLLIADEVMSGWGRTGKWFAVENWDIKPDILTTAKGITGAYLPLSLMATSRRIADYFEANYFAHGHTYEAHPVALAAAKAAIEEYQEKNLIERSKELGIKLSRRLEEIKERHKSVGDVRSIGLFGAVELVKNREKKIPFNVYEEKLEGKPLMTDKISRRAMEKGVYVNNWLNHFVIAPPLVISEDDLTKGLNVLDECLEISDGEVD
ncbi:MAG: aspartate aminotransferase family protein [Thermoplasmatales archaeon]|nr:aspartate aminotransferase family protein [Candidatus Thermoplasmatota archaeon]MDA8054382.1 aspartate aminotransferase family protein [Thermoplasmatales archaeon]